MFEEIVFMIGFTIVSIIVSYLLLIVLPSPLNKLMKVLGIVGIVIHEVCHILMCLITNTKIDSYSLVERIDHTDRKSEFEYGGWVKIKTTGRIAFLQALLVALAPIYLSFWLFFFLLDQLLYANVSEVFFFVSIFLMISLVLGASPSIADLSNIPKAISQDPIYSLYQIFILVLSGGTVWLIITLYNIFLIHDIFYYGSVFFSYYVFKYGLKLVNELWRYIYHTRRGHSKKTKFRKLTRRRFKPMNPKKLGIDVPD